MALAEDKGALAEDKGALAEYAGRAACGRRERWLARGLQTVALANLLCCCAHRHWPRLHWPPLSGPLSAQWPSWRPARALFAAPEPVSVCFCTGARGPPSDAREPLHGRIVACVTRCLVWLGTTRRWLGTTRRGGVVEITGRCGLAYYTAAVRTGHGGRARALDEPETGRRSSAGG